jgi:uncharacterized lipoprotein YddW (UPF0748 family)
MNLPGRTTRVRAAAALTLFAGMCLTAPPAGVQARASDPPSPARRPGAPAETRAMWVLRGSLTTPARIAALVRSARDHGFNTLFVQVRGRGDAYFRGGIEPRSPDLLRQPAGFDPLASVLEAAHGAGLRVHAWINVNLVSSATYLPSAREHLIYRHPAWLMIPREIAQDLATIAPESPAYVGKLARWTRAQSTGVEGLYASPIHADAALYAERIVRDVARRYDVDGVHLDYARYPNDRFDYSRGAIRQFRASVRPGLSEAARRRLDAREPVDLFAYPDALPDEWRSFRVARMTALVGRLSAAVRSERPDAQVTAAAAPDATEALDRRLQDWGGWLTAGLIDAICPMAYTAEPARFAELIASARRVAGTRAVWAGIGAYRLSPTETIVNIQTARRLGATGVILFSYDSLIDAQQASRDYLSVVGRGAFSARPVPGTR